MNPSFERGLLLYEQSRHELAEAEFRRALAEDPNDAYTHALLGLCLAEREEFKEATDEAQQAVHLLPDFGFAHYALARIWHDRGYDAEALASVTEALRLDPAAPGYFALLASIHMREARWQQALEAAENGLRLDAEHVACSNLRAVALVKLGRKSEAGATIDATLRRNPENALSHANQGWTYLERRQPEKALEHFREALRLDPNNEWARRGIVEALKARHFIYALMLRYFLFMAKFSRRAQWGIILGAYFGNHILGVLAQTNPALAPWILPLRILYLAFALMTWLASPLFNLLLRLNRFGRLALSRDQTVASNWIGLLLLLVILSLLGCVRYGFDSLCVMALAIFGFLLLPVAGTFRCPVGPARKFMGWYASVAAGAGIAGLLLTLASGPGAQISFLRISGALLMFLCIIGSAAASWIINIFLLRRQRR